MTVQKGARLNARSTLHLLGAGAAAGLVSSLAIGALVMLAERVALLPMGTFYMVLALAVLHSANYSVYAILQGLLMHLAAGTMLGLLIAAPFATSKTRSMLRFAPALGLAAGVLVWVGLFLPVTYGVMAPLLKSFEGQPDIRQRAPDSFLFQVAISDLVSMIDRVVYTALAFNVLYGLIALIMTRSLAGAPRGEQVIL